MKLSAKSVKMNLKKDKLTYLLIFVIMMLAMVSMFLLCSMNKRKEASFLFETEPDTTTTTTTTTTTVAPDTTVDTPDTTTTTTTTTVAPDTTVDTPDTTGECVYDVRIGQDFSVGSDLWEEPGTADECQLKCNDRPDCLGFARHTQAGHCWFKGNSSPDWVTTASHFTGYQKRPGCASYPS